MQTLKGLSPTGTTLWPYHSISRADPLLAAADSTLGLLTHSLASQAVLIWGPLLCRFLLPQSVTETPPSQGGCIQ